MKSIYTIILTTFAFVFFISCDLIPEKKNSSPVNNDGTTIHRTYYEKSGDIKTEITVKNKKKNGPAKKYYPTGEVHTLVNYVDNIKEGETIWYYKNGKPYRVTQYVNGKIEGIRKIYYEDGKLQAEIPYKNNELIIGTKEFTKQGKLITKYPEIIFNAQDNLLIDNKITLTCKMSNNFKKVDFYHEIMDDKNQKKLLVLDTKNGMASIDFRIPSMTKVDKEIIIYAKLKSSLENLYITKNKYRLKVDTN